MPSYWYVYRVDVDTRPIVYTGSDTYRWFESMSRSAGRQARLLAPPGRTSSTKYAALRRFQSTGALRASTSSTLRTYPPIYIMELDVTATEPYAVYVHEGTATQGTGYIYPKNWDALRLPRVSGFRTHHPRVRGQRPNPFLIDGMKTAAAARGLRLRGI